MSVLFGTFSVLLLQRPLFFCCWTGAAGEGRIHRDEVASVDGSASTDVVLPR